MSSEKLLTLNNLSPFPGSIKKKKRVGRGLASGRGKTSSRGMNGQKSKEKVPNLFEGGQRKIYLRKPKRGMTKFKYNDKYVEIMLSHMKKIIIYINNNKIDSTNNVIDNNFLSQIFGKFHFKLIKNDKFRFIDIKNLKFSSSLFSKNAKDYFISLGAQII